MIEEDEFVAALRRLRGTIEQMPDLADKDAERKHEFQLIHDSLERIYEKVRAKETPTS